MGSDPLACGAGIVDITQDPVDGYYSVYMLVLPGNQETTSIHLNIGGNEWVLEKTSPAGGFKSGQKYVVTADLVDFRDMGMW
ncbi:MAG: hypothetical protein PHG14_14970 [Desulfobacter postgatei]|jgi:hypothetical protein|uniref:hypothetical protein n=1 Tax=Desulfobacter postgatei TaxID=2293 RepID=UPI0023F0A810|nr:hypothetical protein [Desulfobacter postgatei]MDD4275015.1 hypothetical protein [Desulfobacter postgatei]